MIKATYVRKRSTKISFLVLGMLVIALLSFSLRRPHFHNNLNSNALYIKQIYSVALREISGISAYYQSNGEINLTFVGDRYAKILQAKFKASALEDINITDLTSLIIKKHAFCSSRAVPGCRKHMQSIVTQMEGVAQDGRGRIFLLNEQLASIFVYDGNQLLSLINLDPGKTLKKKAHLENGFYEGLILMRNGHLLAVKERDEASIVEFGLEGAEPRGYSQALRIDNGEEFLLPAERVVLQGLKMWRLGSDYRSCDLSEVSADQEGSLYILSQQCQFIARLKDLDPNRELVDIDKLWMLPSEIHRAEAFVVLSRDLFLVAEDRKNMRTPAVFLVGSKDSV